MAIFFEDVLKVNNKDKKFHLVKIFSEETKFGHLTSYASIAFYDYSKPSAPIDLVYLNKTHDQNLTPLTFTTIEETKVIEENLAKNLFTEKEFIEERKRIETTLYSEFDNFISESNQKMKNYFDLKNPKNITILEVEKNVPFKRETVSNYNQYTFQFNEMKGVTFYATADKNELKDLKASVKNSIGTHLYHLSLEKDQNRNEEILELLAN